MIDCVRNAVMLLAGHLLVRAACKYSALGNSYGPCDGKTILVDKHIVSVTIMIMLQHYGLTMMACACFICPFRCTALTHLPDKAGLAALRVLDLVG